MGQTITGTPGADTLAETSFRGDTLVGGAGNDTYTWYASFWYDPGFPGLGIPGHTVYYRTHLQEQAGGGKDTAYLHMQIQNIAVTADELPSIETVHVINDLAASMAYSFTLDAVANTVYGSNAKETINGAGGSDTLYGADNHDSLAGGDGADRLEGEAGSDTLSGGAGADTLVFSADADGAGITVYHAAIASLSHELTGYFVSQDVYDGGGGIDRVIGTAGNDALILDTGIQCVAAIERIDAGDGSDVVDLTSGTYAHGSVTIDGGAGNDVLWSNQGSDSVNGGTGMDELAGGAGADTLVGGTGTDRLIGEGGVDRLVGGAGKDTLEGGAGGDLFVFDTAVGPTNIDRVVDFHSGSDKILLSGPVFGSLAHVSYDAATGKLYYDADGAGGADPVQFALLVGKPTLAAGDLQITG